MSEPDWITSVTSLLNSLPDINRLVFLRILPFFAHVVSQAGTNKMSVENLSIVFAPTLFYGDDPDLLSALEDSTIICNLLTKMIIHHEEIADKTTRTNKFKNAKHTMNVSTIFKQQHTIKEMYSPEDLDFDEMDQEELDTIKALLEDNYEAVPISNDGAINSQIEDGSFFVDPNASKSNFKPLPTLPPKSGNSMPVGNISLEKQPSDSQFKPLPTVPNKALPLTPADLQKRASDISIQTNKSLPPLPTAEARSRQSSKPLPTPPPR